MSNLKKSEEKLRSIMLVTALTSMVFGGVACQKTTPAYEASVDRGDEKISADKVAEAEPLYEGREDMAKARVAVATLRQARTADYGNYDAAWKLARASYYVADHADNDSERDDMFREGTEAGTAAIKLQPEKPEGHFWLGANYGGTAAHSTLANLSSFQDIKREMEAVIKLQEGYEGSSAYLGLGRLYLQAPRVFGGDVTKAVEYLEKGLKMSPNNSLMRFHLAEGYEANNRDAEAKKQLEALLSMTPDPKYIPEHKDAVTKAKKLLDKLGSK
jgi:tetratricopeptide (TPR) repeat protein